MSDKERQENFAARLKRIEARQNSEIPADSGVAPPKEPSRFDTPPEEDVTVRNTLIWMAIAIVACVGGFYGIKAMPQDLKDTIAWMTGNGPTGAEAAPPPVIAETDTMSDQGPIVPIRAVAAASGAPITLDQIAQNVTLPTDDTASGQILPFDRNVSCTLRRPLATETIVNIRMENGLLPSSVQAFSAAAVADQLLENVKSVTQDGQTYDHNAQITGTLSAVDVFLTDTTAPLYLVLQNMGPGIVWNIHAAPDVTVAHVAVVSSEVSGLVNIPDTTTFDAVLVSDFVPAHVAGDDSDIRDCMIRPWRNPQADWIGMQKAAAGDTELGDQMQSYSTGYAAYNAWFTKTLGVDAGTDVISVRDAAHVLHGEVPTAPIAYKPMAGQDIHLMRTDHIVTGSALARASTVADLHQRTLLAAVSGNMDDLDPAPVERMNQ